MNELDGLDILTLLKISRESLDMNRKFMGMISYHQELVGVVVDSLCKAVKVPGIPIEALTEISVLLIRVRKFQTIFKAKMETDLHNVNLVA